MRDFRLCHTLRFILAACLFLTAFAVQAAPNLLVSTSPERTAPIALSGAQLNDLVYIFVAPETGIKQVDFYLDNPPPASPRVTERLTPFDFNRTAADLTALPFDTNSIPDGQHSVYARTTYTDGTSELLSATFTVNNSAPAFSFSQTNLDFALEAGSGSKTLQVGLSSSTSGGETFYISDNANWLTVQPTTGTVPETLTITANPDGLSAGQYTATVEATGTGVATAYLTVDLTVVQPSNSAYSLMISTASDRSGATGLNGSTVAGDIYVFVPQQSGMSQVRFYIDNPQKSGSPNQTENMPPYDMAGTAPDDTAYPYDTARLTEGSHTVTAVVSEADGSVHEVTEFFTVANDMAALSFSNTTLSGSRHVDNPDPITTSVSLTASDSSAASFSISSSAGWLSATGDSATTPATISVTADPAGLAAGTYSGKLTASASGYTAGELTYTLTVTSGSQGILTNPTSLVFNGQPNSPISSQTLSVSHSANENQDFTVSTNMPWLSVSPTSGTTPENLTVQVDSSGLTTGSFDATITLTPSTGSAINVPVTMILSSNDKCAPVPCSDVRIDLPYQLTFTEGQGYYPDSNGWGTGFTWLDEPASNSGYIPGNLEMNFFEGVLRYTTTPGIQYLSENSQDNALGVGFAAPNQITQITTEILNLPAGTGNYEQAGLWFGNNQDNYLKMVVISRPEGLNVHYLLEVGGLVINQKNIPVSNLTGSDLTLGMTVNPYTRTVDLTYKPEGGATKQAGSVMPPDEFFSFDAAGIDPEIGTRSFAGIFATHRNGAAPITYLFDEFTMEAGGGPLSPESTVEFLRKDYNIGYPTSMVWGPDDRLYVTELFGTIHALTFDNGMNVIDDQVIESLINSVGPRLTLGITVSPNATAGNMDLWVAHSSPSIDNGEVNSGMVTRLSGTNFANVEHRITGLPRAIANHSINSLHFGPDNRLYIAVGGNTGAGAPNTAKTEFGDRAEQPLSAAIVVADVFAASFDGSCANTSDMYGPPPCDVVPYATGLRNSYDFVFHSNGKMYATDNGLGVTGTYPPKPEPICTGFGNTASYLNGGNNPGTQPDLLLKIQEGKYYGHPNPYREECVFKDGSYQNVAPLPNYEPAIFDLGDHKSSNAIIEYSGAQGCVGDYLNGQLLITNYSIGDDIFRVRLNETGDGVIEGEPLVTGFNDPLPMTSSPNGTIFVGQFGGGKLTSLSPVSLGCWLTLAPSPISILDASGASINARMYMVGGKNASGHLTTLFIYDANSDSWSQGANLPGPGVENPAVVALNGRIYVFGGSTAPFSGAVSNAAVYNPASNSWQTLPPMPTARGGATAQVVNGLIYVVGGMDNSGASLPTVEVFNPGTGAWQSSVGLQTRRDNPGSAVLNGELYVFGGRVRNSDGSAPEPALSSVEKYSAATNTWQYMTPMPTGRRAMSVGTAAGKVQIMGGEANPNSISGVFEQNEEYDPATNSWRSLTKIPTPKHGAATATIGNKVHIVGGGVQTGTSYTSSHEVLQF